MKNKQGEAGGVPRRRRKDSHSDRKRRPKVLHIFHWRERYEVGYWQEGMPFIKHIIGSGAGSTEANQFLGQLKELRALTGARYHHIRSIYYDIAGLAAAAQPGFRGYVLNESFGALDDRRLAARIELSVAETRESLKALLAVNLLEKIELPEFGDAPVYSPKRRQGDTDDPNDAQERASDVKSAQECARDVKNAQERARDVKNAQERASDAKSAQGRAKRNSEAACEMPENRTHEAANADSGGPAGDLTSTEDMPKDAVPLEVKGEAESGNDQSSKRENPNGQAGQGQGQAKGQASTIPTTAPPTGAGGPDKPQEVTAQGQRHQTRIECGKPAHAPAGVYASSPKDAFSMGECIGEIAHRYSLAASAFADEIQQLLRPPYPADGREGRREHGNYAAAFQEAVDARLDDAAMHDLIDRANHDAMVIGQHRSRYYRKDGSPEQYWRFRFSKHLVGRLPPSRAGPAESE